MHRGERFNTFSHLTGAVAAMVGLIVLLYKASLQNDLWKITGVGIYGVSLFFLYLSSTLYHSFPKGNIKTFFRKMDHYAIYLLIAGSYTPFALITLHGAWGWVLFGIIWSLALIGIIIDSRPKAIQGKRVLPLMIYMFMGWLGVVAIKPMVESLPMEGLWLVLIGGLFYTVGVVFYVFDRKILHFHGIWHLFVLAGSTAHYFTIFLYVA